MPKVGDYVRNHFTGDLVLVVGRNKKGFSYIPTKIVGGFVYRAGFHAYTKVNYRKGSK